MDFAMHMIQEYGLIAVFFLILLEYACFPIPSEVVLPFSGAVASQSGVHFFVILGLSVLAGLLGSLICYALGYFGGRPLVDKIADKFPKTRKGIHASQQTYAKYAVVSVGVGRMIPLCRTYISFIAGMARQNLFTYILSTAVGVTVWNIILVGLGYVFSENWTLVVGYYNEYKLILIPVVVLAVAAVVLWKFRDRIKIFKKK